MKKFTLLWHAPWHEEGLGFEEGILKAQWPDMEVTCLEARSKAEMLRLLPEADGLVISELSPLDRETLNHFERCKFIVTQTMGLDHIDMDAARERGLIVVNLPDYCLEEVSDHALALILGALRHIPVYDRQIHSGIWDVTSCPAPKKFKDTVLGFAGFGRLGQLTARKAGSVFTQIIAYDPFMNKDAAAALGVTPVNSLEELFSEADVVSLHIPATPQTEKMVNAKLLALVKPGFCLVNTGRGKLVDEPALRDALVSGRVRIAALDVLTHEPPEEGNPLVGLENAIITPHVAWRSDQTNNTLRELSALEAGRILSGEGAKNVVK